MCTSGGSGGGAVFHMSTGLWMLSPEPPPPFRQRSGCFTTARGAPGRSPRSSTGVSTLVDNSTVVIYEKPCETTENQLNMRLRRDPGGHIDVLCTASSTACGWCGQIIPAPGGLRYGNHPRIHPQPSTGLAPHSSTNYTVDTQLSVDGCNTGRRSPDRGNSRSDVRNGGTCDVVKHPRTRSNENAPRTGRGAWEKRGRGVSATPWS